MPVELLIERIDGRLAELRASEGASERGLLTSAKLDGATIRRIRDRGQIPGPAILAKLEAALRVTPGYFIESVTDRLSVAQGTPLQSVYVRGEVQAGVWREAAEWRPTDWFAIMVPVDPRIPDNVERFGLLVRGRSMDRLYPEGTVVIAVRYWDIRRQPRSGDKVVVLRRSVRTGEFEATLKEYEHDAQGRHILWPRSTDPTFQAPFVLRSEHLPLADGDEGVPAAVSADHDAGETDLRITGLVVGSYRPELGQI